VPFHAPESPDRASLAGAHASNWGFADPKSRAQTPGSGAAGASGGASGGAGAGEGWADGGAMEGVFLAPVPATPQPPASQSLSRLGTSHSRRDTATPGSRGKGQQQPGR